MIISYMLALFFKLVLLSLFLFGSVVCIAAQSAEMGAPGSGHDEEKAETPKTFKDMLTKQRVEREKKDHEEMIKHGEEAVTLSSQLDDAFAKRSQLSDGDRQKLESLEKIVLKIRKELGGGDDDDDEDDVAVVRERRPSNLREAFDNLKATTLKLVDELNNTTRFSISVIAIQSSNTVLKLVRFLQLRK